MRGKRVMVLVLGISGASGVEDEACGAYGVEKAGLKPDVSG